MSRGSRPARMNRFYRVMRRLSPTTASLLYHATSAQRAAVAFMIIGYLITLVGFRTTSEALDLVTFMREIYANLGIELISIGLTVLVIERLTRREVERERITELMIQMRSRSDVLALQAVELLRLRGALRDGSLSQANLVGGNLAGADLSQASLIGARMANMNLEGANLFQAQLTNTDLSNANLRHVNFVNADLESADFYDSDLTYAVFRSPFKGVWGQLIEATFNSETVLPDGTNWTPETDMRRFTNPDYVDATGKLAYWRSHDPQSPAYGGADHADDA